jgi:hypothetical protein
MIIEIYKDIADQTARNLAKIDSEFAGKMSRRIRRKFSTTLSREIIFEQASHFKEIYQYAGSRLPECLKPSIDGYADSKNIDADRYMVILREKFSDENPEILKIIAGWVVYYEYLR